MRDKARSNKIIRYQLLNQSYCSKSSLNIVSSLNFSRLNFFIPQSSIKRPFSHRSLINRFVLERHPSYSIRVRGSDILRINYLLRWSAMREMRRDMRRGWWNVCMPGAYHRATATAICSFRIRFPTGCLRISFYSSYVAGTAPK